jgi:uncharacterized protein (DUF488 family)
MPEPFTIGHSTQSWEQFLERLVRHRIDAVGDVRSSPYSARLPQFNREILEREGSWDVYEREFLGLMDERHIEDKIDPSVLAGGRLLCSEETPHHCHRRLVLDYLQKRWGNLSITHIV